MILYRIAKKNRARDLSGKGAFKAGGRWTPKGILALYTAQHASLAAWEVFVHRVEEQEWPENYYLITIEVPDKHKDYLTVKPERLPADWETFKHSSEIQNLGRKWFTEDVKLGVFVPSVVMKDEWNVILNLIHPQFKALVKIKKTELFSFDKRLKGSFLWR